jgi:methyl-accepting chemotaxis protein
MSFRYKLFSILGISQLVLLLVLILSFVLLLEKVKNEPQDLRAFEQAEQFHRELDHKKEIYSKFISYLKENPKYIDILSQGLKDRTILEKNLESFTNLMKENSLSIFEIGDETGKVYFRFHRPKDYGDDKSNQKIIQEAIAGKTTTILESGHSGLGFRLAAPFMGKTVLIGQKVDQDFLYQISTPGKTHIALFESNKLIASSGEFIQTFVDKYGNVDNIKEKNRIKFVDDIYYIVKLPYTSEHQSNLKLSFLFLIDETSLNKATNKVWFYFTIITLVFFILIFGASFVFSEDIVRAVKNLNFAMKNIEIDETEILNLNRKDEIGQMSNSFVKMKSELISHQNNLEEKIAEKTEELQTSLAQVNKLKYQQDGDYFLTSLLIEPLMSSEFSKDIIQIESIIKQKKSFDFKGKNVQIGGDLCIVDTILLKGEEYTLFVNADAMGKSLQGASGALVFGTVFKSLLVNLQEITEFQTKYPESWLFECYKDLQKVFLSFNGSMLVSCVIGLISNKNGALYFFNAEHPFLILFRDGKAEFIDKEIHIRKIGIESSDLEFQVNCFQLESGDILFLGSDGKDELIMHSEDQEHSINMNEKLILETIEKSKGSLENLELEINSQGKVNDDLSIMKISYDLDLTKKVSTKSKKFKDAYSKALEAYKNKNVNLSILILEEFFLAEPENIFVKKLLSKLYTKTKRYTKAIRMSEEYLKDSPLDSEILYHLSNSYKLIGEKEKALELSERLFLRNPIDKKVIKQLKELYQDLSYKEKLEVIETL